MGPLRFEARGHFALSPEELWSFVADTQRLNRAIGLPTAAFTHSGRADGGSVATGTYRTFGITLARWIEHPFEFVRPYRYQVLREYEAGLFLRFRGGAELTPANGGTDMVAFAEFTPRNPLGWLAAKLVVGPRSSDRVVERCRQFESAAVGRDEKATPTRREVPPAWQASPGPPPDVDRGRLRDLGGQLTRLGVDAGIAALLQEHIAMAPDDRVSSMRPFELADLWGVDRHATLVTFLQATTVGLLKMSWDVLCPYCRVPKAEYASLADVAGQAHCEHCNITFDAKHDHLVEVRFGPSPAVREVFVGLYCIGGPQNTPHVLAQEEMDPGEAVEWDVPLDSKAYRLRSPQSGGAAIIEIVEGEQGPPVALTIEEDRIAPPLLRVSGQRLALRLESRLQAPAVVALEAQFWPDTAATAAVVSSIQEFRDLFSSELLAPGLQVAIERIALLFTDLASSTAMYERVGQARAFRLVQDHFRILDGAIRDHQGAMVKTIGDAVMAVFSTTQDAVAAALAMQCRVRDLEVPEGVDPVQLLKVGVHAGPVVAVTSNDRLDYFGTTVNVAARAQHEALGGQIILTADAYAEAGVEELVRGAARDIQGCSTSLRGISEPVPLYRVLGVSC